MLTLGQFVHKMICMTKGMQQMSEGCSEGVYLILTEHQNLQHEGTKNDVLALYQKTIQELRRGW